MKRPDTNRPQVFAHRGASKLAPENTLPAFEEAVRLGADGIELDVQYTSDGRIVCIHNLTLDKTTNGSGRVVSHTFEELRKLDAGSWFHERFAGTPLPLLDEALEFVKGKLLVNIELKVRDRHENGLAADVVKAVRMHRMVDQVVLSCFNAFVLRAALIEGPEFDGGLLLAPDMPGWTRWNLTERYSRATSLHPEFVMVDEEYVLRARRARMPVRVWTVDEETDMSRMIGLGVDAIITNYPDRLLRILEAPA